MPAVCPPDLLIITATHDNFLCIRHLRHLQKHYLMQQAWAIRACVGQPAKAGCQKIVNIIADVEVTQAAVAGYTTSYSNLPLPHENGTTTQARSTQPAHRDIHRTRLQHCCRAHRQGTRVLGEAQHNSLTTEGLLPRHCVRPHACMDFGGKRGRLHINTDKHRQEHTCRCKVGPQAVGMVAGRSPFGSSTCAVLACTTGHRLQSRETPPCPIRSTKHTLRSTSRYHQQHTSHTDATE